MPRLFLRFSVRLVGLFHERDNACEFFFETGNEIMRAVFKEHDEAEREKNEKDQPKEPANQRHRLDRKAGEVPGQSVRHPGESSD